MAEQIEPVYLNYGTDAQINLNDFLNAAANNDVESYLAKQPWSPKRKNLFRQAYLEIMSLGVTGATNQSGYWEILYGGTPIDLSTKSKKEQEMYGEAAYYIQQLMNGLLTKKVEEEKKKSDLPVFDNAYFTKGLNGYIGNQLYGGLNWSSSLWNEIDERGERGLRGTNKRANKLAEMLRGYLGTIDKDKVNFEGSPFTDYDDFSSRVNIAITELTNGTWNLADKDSLNRIGINPDNYFNNGSGDTFTADDGNQYTYGDYYGRILPAQEKQKVEEAAAKLKAVLQQQLALKKQLLANLYRRFRFHTGTGVSLEQLSKYPDVIGQLNSYGQSGLQLTLDLKNELIGAFQAAAKNNQLQNLSKKELARFGSRYVNSPTRLKKLPGLNGFYWDSIGNRVILPFMEAQSQLSFLDLVNLNNPQGKKLSQEDFDIIGADVVSMLGDIVSLGGGYAGAAGGLTTIVSDLYADLRRGKDFWDTAKNLAKNTAWGFAGLIPGAKLAKLGKRAAQLYALFNSYGIITDPNVHKSWKKLINGEDFTSHDFENLKWTLHAFTGVHNTARSHFTDKAIQNKTLKTTIETKNGTKSITQDLVKEINKAGGRGGQQKALDKFKEITGEEAKQGQFLFNTEGRKWYNPTRYSQKLRNLTSDETPLRSQTQINNFAVERLLALDRNKPILANPFRASTYKGWFIEGGPNRGYYTMALAKSYNSSKLDLPQLLTNPQLQPQPLPTTNNEPISPARILKIRNAYKSYLNINSSKGRKYSPSTNDIGTNPDKLKLSITIKGETVEFDLNSGKLVINGTDTGISMSGKSGMRNVRKKISEELKQRMKSTIENGKKIKTPPQEFRNMVKEIQKLKKSGFLKQGGTLDKQKIQRYKEFIKK